MKSVTINVSFTGLVPDSTNVGNLIVNIPFLRDAVTFLELTEEDSILAYAPIEDAEVQEYETLEAFDNEVTA